MPRIHIPQVFRQHKPHTTTIYNNTRSRETKGGRGYRKKQREQKSGRRPNRLRCHWKKRLRGGDECLLPPWENEWCVVWEVYEKSLELAMAMLMLGFSECFFFLIGKGKEKAWEKMKVGATWKVVERNGYEARRFVSLSALWYDDDTVTATIELNDHSLHRMHACVAQLLACFLL